MVLSNKSETITTSEQAVFLALNWISFLVTSLQSELAFMTFPNRTVDSTYDAKEIF